ncbi:MAG: substrate-binding domain-containing protein [Verrucomicrobia bacterium]|nr:substrate-binding domain-containing protein [Verrucomicrobiota bacterium]MCH8513142.1 helix-turn-helix domain-containing protein [Kiritimatiellia bacterium]
MKKNKQLALALSLSGHHFRRIIEGLGEVLQYHPEWELLWDVGNLSWATPKVWTSEADAVITHAIYPCDQPAALAFPGHVICVSNKREETLFDAVVSDDVEVGRAAARHMLGLGLKQHVFLGTHQDHFYSRERGRGFQEEVTRHANQDVLDLTWDWYPGKHNLEAIEGVVQTIRTRFRPPFSIYCDSDTMAFDLLGVATRLGLRAPEDFVLMGNDNIHVICSLSRPRLSSVELNSPEIGRRVGELLLEGRSQSPRRIKIPPLGVVARHSTEISAVEDRVLSKMLAHIHENKGLVGNIEDLAKQAGISRRLLEKRFQKEIGRSPYQEILRCRLEYAREMLMSTDWPVSRVAETCGFAEIHSFNLAFKKETGTSPRKYRQGGQVAE